jgi:drug/metabolite transporter (DMT)-like permease
VTAVALGVATALCWGLADFLGGLRTRRLTLAAVLLVSQLTGLVTIAVVVAVANLESPAADAVAPALVAGVCQLAGIAALYRALAIGTMSVISPISASGAALLPVIVGLATGERPGALQVAGMTAAFAGVMLATRADDSAGGGAPSRQALALGAVAALGFGGFYVGMDAAVAEAEPFWALLAARTSAGVVLAAVLLCLRPRLGADPAAVPSLALIGLLDVGANACFTLGAETGLLSVVAVLASLYPVGTVVLARALLGERLARLQAAGVTFALAGVALIAAG